MMEDEGTWSDHTSGVASTDGKWHHIAVTWRSSDGEVKLYDNGREVRCNWECYFLMLVRHNCGSYE